MSPLLALNGVSFGYGSRRILRELSFSAMPGEFIAVLGANGEGKSTLLDLISGFRTADSGEVSIAGRPLRGWRPRDLARQVSHLPQAVHADLPFSAGQVVAMGRYPHTDDWFESPEDHRAIEAAMLRTQCWEWKDRAMTTLSGGERQRVLLAACLAQQAGMLLLDEPSTFLDIAQQLSCFSLLREEAEAGRLCLAVTHDLNLALRFCSRLLVLAGGRIARDLATSTAREDAEWLKLFSPRLHLGQVGGRVAGQVTGQVAGQVAAGEAGAGAPWVWYE